MPGYRIVRPCFFNGGIDLSMNGNDFSIIADKLQCPHGYGWIGSLSCKPRPEGRGVSLLITEILNEY